MAARIIPYPLSSASLSIRIAPFTFWRPSFTHRKWLTEAARADGETIWWARFACIQISYARMV